MQRVTPAGHYHDRIDRVIDHVYAHVGGDLSLGVLARVAGFSPYHFHRLFKALTGENLNDFVRRVRLERAAALMRASPGSSLTRVAYDSGFSSLSTFSRSFKQFFGVSPGSWSPEAFSDESKIGQTDGSARCYVRNDDAGGDQDFVARLVRLPACRVAYVRIVKPWMEGRLAAGYGLLKEWLESNGMDVHERLLMGLSPDDPDLTPPEKIRYDFCVSVDEKMVGAGAIGIRHMPGCEVVSVHCPGDLGRVARAWDYLYRSWLPCSEYEPANLPALEIYRAAPDETGWDRYDIDCCIPVVRFSG